MSLGKANALLRERYGLIQQARGLYEAADAESRDLTSEEQEQWDRMMADADRLEARANKIQEDLSRLEALELEREDTREQLLERGDRNTDPEEFAEKYKSAFWRAMTGGLEVLERDEAQMLRRNFRSLTGKEVRALGVQTKGTNSAGGFLVPEDFRAELMVALKQFGGMRQAARTITTATGRDLPWPRMDDTGNAAKYIAEATAISTSTPVSFGSVTLEAAMAHSGPIKISWELDQDAELPIEDIVMDAMRIRFGRLQNLGFTTRSSTEAVGPHGIVNDSTGAVTLAGGAAAFNSFDTLYDLEATVDPAYRALPGTGWMFNDTTRKLIRKLRENSTAGTGEYLWQPSQQAGDPDNLLGYPVYINQDLPNFSTGGTTKPIFFGNFRYYIIRDVREMFMQRLVERYAEEGVYALLGYARWDGRGVLPSTDPARKPYRALLSST